MSLHIGGYWVLYRLSRVYWQTFQPLCTLEVTEYSTVYLECTGKPSRLSAHWRLLSTLPFILSVLANLPGSLHIGGYWVLYRLSRVYWQTFQALCTLEVTEYSTVYLECTGKPSRLSAHWRLLSTLPFILSVLANLPGSLHIGGYWVLYRLSWVYWQTFQALCTLEVTEYSTVYLECTGKPSRLSAHWRLLSTLPFILSVLANLPGSLHIGGYWVLYRLSWVYWQTFQALCTLEVTEYSTVYLECTGKPSRLSCTMFSSKRLRGVQDVKCSRCTPKVVWNVVPISL